MKTLVLRASSLTNPVHYLQYFFLRFPGVLADEERLLLSCFDTFDRRWTRQGQVWVQRGDQTILVAPPSLEPLSDDVTQFGLQQPVKIGAASLRVRRLEFALDQTPVVAGHLVKTSGVPLLVLTGAPTRAFSELELALVNDGWTVVTEGAWWVKETGPSFEGARTMSLPKASEPAARYLVEAIRDSLRVARQYEEGIRRDIDTECLHQYRVFLRRARSLASLARPWKESIPGTAVKDALRTLQQQTNLLRDLDVLLLDWPRLQAAMPWDEGQNMLPWHAEVQTRRQKEWRRVKAWLTSTRHDEVWNDLERQWESLASDETWTFGEFYQTALAHAVRSLRRGVKAAQDEGPDQVLHDLRIRVKRLRYVLDAIHLASGAARTVIASLKRAQEELGHFQDQSLLLERLRSESEALREGPSKVDLLAFGILLGHLAGDHQRLKARAQEAAGWLRSKDFRKALDKLVATESEGPLGA